MQKFSSESVSLLPAQGTYIGWDGAVTGDLTHQVSGLLQ